MPSMRMLLGLGMALLTAPYPAAAELAPASPVPPSLEGPTNTVPCFSRAEFRLDPKTTFSNPFDPSEADLSLEIRQPKGKILVIPAFYCQEYERALPNGRDLWRDWSYPNGQPVWKARFAPTEPGRHRVKAVLRKGGVRAVSPEVSFMATRSKRKGYLRVSATDPRFLEHSTGEPFFAIGQNLAFIGESQYLTLPRVEQLLAETGVNGMNYARVWACSEDWAMAIEARKSAWSRSWNWNPPFAPSPLAGETADCVCLSSQRPMVRCEPTRTTAVRPSTSYRLALQYLTEPQNELSVEAHGQSYTLAASGRMEPWSNTNLVFLTGEDERWLNGIKFTLKGSGSAWIRGISLMESNGGPELLEDAVIREKVRGHYNLLDSHWLDQVLAAAEKSGVYLQVCLLTRDLYMGDLKDEKSPAYDLALHDAKKLLRYAVARWGYSTHLGAWEYFNEINPALPTSRFYAELAAYLNEIDWNRHLRTTSTWAASARDCQEDSLDLADVHFYLRPADRHRLTNEVAAVLDRTNFLRQHAPRKPAHLGEFGLADDKWRITDAMSVSRDLADVHNALWASALSGGSGTVLPWWWERIDESRGRQIYKVLGHFLSNVPWTSGDLAPAHTKAQPLRLTPVGLSTPSHSWIWLFDSQAHWEAVVVNRSTPETIRGAKVEITMHKPGRYRYEWWNTRTGQILDFGKSTSQGGLLTLEVPPFDRDIACKVWR